MVNSFLVGILFSCETCLQSWLWEHPSRGVWRGVGDNLLLICFCRCPIDLTNYRFGASGPWELPVFERLIFQEFPGNPWNRGFHFPKHFYLLRATELDDLLGPLGWMFSSPNFHWNPLKVWISYRHLNSLYENLCPFMVIKIQPMAVPDQLPCPPHGGCGTYIQACPPRFSFSLYFFGIQVTLYWKLQQM